MEKKKKRKMYSTCHSTWFFFYERKKKGKGIEREQTLSHSHSQKLFPFNLVVSWLLVGFSFEPPPPGIRQGFFFFAINFHSFTHSAFFFFSHHFPLFLFPLYLLHIHFTHTHIFKGKKKLKKRNNNLAHLFYSFPFSLYLSLSPIFFKIRIEKEKSKK
jgi:hypothetical protein